jgi:FAD/FMN-containing dehydrogenase
MPEHAPTRPDAGGDPSGLSLLSLRCNGFDRRVLTLAPGAAHPIDEAAWADRLVVVEAGEIELECRGGARVRFVRGDVLFVDGLSARVLRNPGRGSAVLGTVARHAGRRSPVDEFYRGSPSDPMTTQEERAMQASHQISTDELRSAVTGRVIGPDDDGYDAARTVFYGGIDRRPSAIVKVAGADDVARVVTLAREAALELAVRSGGHSMAGHGVSDGGLVIDLSRMKAIEIDPDSKTAWAQTGLTAGEYTIAAGAHGLATGFGDTASVGIGGITLGGGVGYLVRKHGLTIDDLLAAEIVTADGEVLSIDEDAHPDMFWAIRGGGGNFGVATRFRFRLHDLPSVVGGMLILPADAATIRAFVDAAEHAPEGLSGIGNVMPAPPMPFVPAEAHGKLVIFALLCYAGDAAAGERAMEPFRALAKPVLDQIRPVPYHELYPPEEEGYHPLAAARNLFVDEVDDASAEAIVERLMSWDAPMRVVQLRVLGGAIARVPNDATAFAHRGRRLMINVASMYGAPEERPAHEEWVAALAREIQRGPEAAYVNFVGDEGPGRVRQAYPGSTFDRLAEIKATYDPTNLFRLNQNVPPGRSPG